MLTDNRTALDAGWDNDLLKIELQDLDAAGFDLALTGFDLDEIAALTLDATEGLTDPDAVPDAPDVPVTVLGDVWLLGRHRLMCGDSTSIDAVERLMDGRRAALWDGVWWWSCGRLDAERCACQGPRHDQG